MLLEVVPGTERETLRTATDGDRVVVDAEVVRGLCVVGDLVEAVQYCRVGEYPATCILHAVAVELDFVNPSIGAWQ